MSIFSRMTATLVATVDQAVAKVENHDAIVEASIKQIREAAVRAKVRLTRVRRDGQNLAARIRTIEEEHYRWSERARQCAQDDEKRALDCLRRRKHCETQLQTLRESFSSHQELERRIATNVAQIEERLEATTQQRNVMRSRQSTAEALQVLNKLEGCVPGDIGETFDRWEILIAEHEIAVGEGTQIDQFEQQFIQSEDEQTLRDELAKLVASTDKGANHDSC